MVWALRWAGSYISILVASEIHLSQLHVMQTMAGACRPAYPFCQRKVPGNILQEVHREV